MKTEEFAAFITELRKSHNYTQSELADKLHVSASAVSKWERGKCLPEVSKFEDIAKLFDISIVEVMKCRVNLNNSETMSKDEIDETISKTIELTNQQNRQKNRKGVKYFAFFLVICLLGYMFPVYHIAKVWSLDYYTTGDIAKLMYRGNINDIRKARVFVAKADEAFSDLTTPYDELEKKYGLFKQYAPGVERGGTKEKHSLHFWSAHFNTFDGYGYIWVYYSHSLYDENKEEIWASRGIPSLWIFEKGTDGEWKLMFIKEAP